MSKYLCLENGLTGMGRYIVFTPMHAAHTCEAQPSTYHPQVSFDNRRVLRGQTPETKKLDLTTLKKLEKYKRAHITQ